MHGLETIRRLNDRAVERCEDCGKTRHALEAHGSFLASYDLGGDAPTKLCREDRMQRAELQPYRAARRENEVV
jgi:hypothetical protein